MCGQAGDALCRGSKSDTELGLCLTNNYLCVPLPSFQINLNAEERGGTQRVFCRIHPSVGQAPGPVRQVADVCHLAKSDC